MEITKKTKGFKTKALNPKEQEQRMIKIKKYLSKELAGFSGYVIIGFLEELKLDLCGMSLNESKLELHEEVLVNIKKDINELNRMLNKIAGDDIFNIWKDIDKLKKELKKKWKQKKKKK